MRRQEEAGSHHSRTQTQTRAEADHAVTHALLCTVCTTLGGRRSFRRITRTTRNEHTVVLCGSWVSPPAEGNLLRLDYNVADDFHSRIRVLAQARPRAGGPNACVRVAIPPSRNRGGERRLLSLVGGWVERKEV